MNNKDVNTIMDKLQEDMVAVVDVKKLDYVLDFGSVSAVITLGYN